MLTEQTVISRIDILDQALKSVMITMDTIIYRDEVKIASSSESRTFSPGQIDLVAVFIGSQDAPEIAYITALWS